MSEIVVGEVSSPSNSKIIFSDGITFDTPLKLKSYTAVELAALTGMTAGEIVYESTNKKVNVYTGNAWTEIGALDGIRQTSYDVINEASTGVGVTIDGVLHQDGEIYLDVINEDSTNVGVTIDGVLVKDDSVTVDNIYEKTTGAGVTVDGVLLKDGKLTGTIAGFNEQKNTISSSSGVLSVDVEQYNTFQCSLTENITQIDFTNIDGTNAHNIQIIFYQPISGSTYTVANSVTVNGGIAVTPKTAGNAGFTATATNGAVDILTFTFISAGIPFLTAVQDIRNS